MTTALDASPAFSEPHSTSLNGMEGRLVSLQVGRAQQLDFHGKEWESAIFKHPVNTRLRLNPTQLDGDQQFNLRFHGGPDKAVCIYSAEHYSYWQNEYGMGDTFTYGAFGENFTVSGLLETDVCIGDVFAVGSATIQVCQPRQPCVNVARRWDKKELPSRMIDLGRTGYYARVLEPGDVGADDTLALRERPYPGISVMVVNRAVYQHEGGAALMERLASLPLFAASGRRVFQKREPRG